MKNVFLVIVLVLLSRSLSAQDLKQVKFSQSKTLEYFTVITDREVNIRLSATGGIIAFGVEQQSIRNSNYYSPQLQPYVGPVEYYDQGVDSAFAGKIRRIGSSIITYYGSYEMAYRRGKIKSIGYLSLDYNEGIDPSVKGKLKSIGNLGIQFYSSFENESIRGKLKSVGNTSINYYSNFDDRSYGGKVKSIDRAVYTYYSSVDRRELQGALKSGLQRTEVLGIVYVLW